MFSSDMLSVVGCWFLFLLLESSGRCTNTFVSGCCFSRLSPKNVCVLGTKGLITDKKTSASLLIYHILKFFLIHQSSITK